MKRRRADDDAALELATEGCLPVEEIGVDRSGIAVQLELKELDVAEGVEKQGRTLSRRFGGMKAEMAAKKADGFEEDVIEKGLEEIYRGSGMGGRRRREEEGEENGVG